MTKIGVRTFIDIGQLRRFNLAFCFISIKKSTIALDYYVFSKCLSDQQQIIEGLVWLIRLMQLALVSGNRPIRHIMVNTGP